jgi:hypothetical protein
MFGWLKRKTLERAIVLPAVGKRFRYGGTELYVDNITWRHGDGVTVTLRSESPDFHVKWVPAVEVAEDEDGATT